MSHESVFLVNRIKKLYENDLFVNNVAQVKSKALLKEVSDTVPQYKWSFSESQIVRNLDGASHVIESLCKLDLEKISEILPLVREVAITWENIARLDENTDKYRALMNAAVIYDIAGYQANAVCLSRKVFAKFSEPEKPTVEILASVFLQRLFLRLRNLCETAMQEPSVSNSQQQLYQNLGVAIAAEGFMKASLYLTGNDISLEEIKTLLSRSQLLFSSIGCPMEANILHSISALLPIIMDRSVWLLLKRFAPNNSMWIRYLQLLSRGIGENILCRPSMAELWPSQIKALQNGLLSSKYGNVVRMPTSAGKTRVAEMAIIHSLATNQGSKCIYIAPYKALTWELEEGFLNLFSDLGISVSSMVGSYETDDLEQLLINEADILITTPEKVDLLLRSQPGYVDLVKLFVIDEGHILDDLQRGIKFQLLLARLKKRNPTSKFLFLSAVLPRETLENFTKLLESDTDSIIESNWRPSIQRFAGFYWEGNSGFLQYFRSGDQNSLLREFVPGVIRRNIYQYKDKEKGKIRHPNFPDTKSKAETAAELAFKFSGLGPVLVFCITPKSANAIAKSLSERLSYATLDDHSLKSNFLNPDMERRSVKISEEWFGDDHYITKLLKNGIAVHHSEIPEMLRRGIERDFRERKYDVIIATTTLAHGVNLPIRTVIVHSCNLFNRFKGVSNPMPARDYWNIAGRAGRAGKETEGTIIHMITKSSDYKDINYYLEAEKNLEPIEGALFRYLDEIVRNGLSKDFLSKKLDPEILALLAEQENFYQGLETVAEIIEKSLKVGNTILDDQHKIALHEVVSSVTSSIKEEVADKNYWPIYSATGLAAKSCEEIKKKVVASSEILVTLLRNANSTSYKDLLEIILDSVVKLDEIQSDNEYPGSYFELLNSWLMGTSLSDIIKDFKSEVTKPEDLTSLIDELFSYRLPWIISGFITIARFELHLEEKDLSMYVRFLSSMVKYGVPNPAASWAMAIGIPYRKIAIGLGAKYLSKDDSPDFNKFRKWFRNSDPKSLLKAYSLTVPVIEDILLALEKSTKNSLLTYDESSPREVVKTSWIKGIFASENSKILASNAKRGDIVRLERDYSNMYDRNAIAVILHGQHLGMLDKDVAQVMAPLMDSGLSMGGVITVKERGRRTEIQIEIYEKKD